MHVFKTLDSGHNTVKTVLSASQAGVRLSHQSGD